MNRLCRLPLTSACLPLLLLAFGSAAALGQEKGPANPAKWEYKVVPEITWEAQPDKSMKAVRLTEAELNKLGDEGWELSGVVSRTEGGPAKGGSISTNVYFVFKRPKR